MNLQFYYSSSMFSTLNQNNPISESNSFNEWLDCLIDGDGYFSLSKKGYASLEIVMET